jgi:DNA-binding MarR family transcriptional regulator
MANEAIGQKRTSELAADALELARRWRRVYPHGGFEDIWEPAELQILISLLGRPGQTVRQLADSLELARPTISNALRRLLDERLVKATPDPDDARSQLLSVTDAGEQLAKRFLGHAEPHLSAD